MNIINQIMYYGWYFIAAAVIIFPWYIISKTFEGFPNSQAKALAKAKKLGHVCKAHLLKEKYIPGGWNQNPALRFSYLCTYTYKYKDKTYKKKVRYDEDDTILDEIELYFISNPKKAALPNSITISNKSWVLRYVIVLTIILLIKFLLIK